MAPMLSWLKKLLSLPGDLKAGQIVLVRGVGRVRVVHPCPRGPHSSGFEGVNDAGEELVYSRDEIQ